MGNLLSLFKNIFLKEDDELKNNNQIEEYKSNYPYDKPKN